MSDQIVAPKPKTTRKQPPVIPQRVKRETRKVEEETVNDAERSEELMHLLGKTPSWILRWGNTFFLVFILSFFAVSFIVKYPETIEASIIITTPTPPVSLKARTTGRINNLYVKDQGSVTEGEVLALINTTADYKDVQAVKKALSDPYQLEFFKFEEIKLGSLQPYFENLIQVLDQQKHFEVLGYHSEKMKELSEVLIIQEKMEEQQLEQINLLDEELTILSEKFADNKHLYRKKAITKSQFMDFKMAFMQKEKEKEVAEQQLLQLQMEIESTKSSKNDLARQLYDESYTHNKEIVKAKNTFQNAIKDWEKEHLLVSPTNGTVTFFSYWSENQQVNISDEILTVIPDDTSQIIGKMMMPEMNSGKVKPGQKVTIQLDGYPYKEYGMVHGTLASVSLVPRNQLYVAEVNFPEGLKTSYKRTIELKQQMTGKASIITENQSLFARIMHQFNNVLKNKTNISQ